MIVPKSPIASRNVFTKSSSVRTRPTGPLCSEIKKSEKGHRKMAAKIRFLRYAGENKVLFLCPTNVPLLNITEKLAIYGEIVSIARYDELNGSSLSTYSYTENLVQIKSRLEGTLDLVETVEIGTQTDSRYRNSGEDSLLEEVRSLTKKIKKARKFGGSLTRSLEGLKEAVDWTLEKTRLSDLTQELASASLETEVLDL